MERSGTSNLVLLLLLAVRLGPVAGQITNDNLQACNGIFDFYFLLDSSGSIGDDFRNQVVPFVSNVTNLYTEPELRVSIISFATQPTVHLELTRIAEREAIDEGIESLRNQPTSGFSNVAPAIREVVDQIVAVGGDRASVVLMLTDGVLHDSDNSLETAVELAHVTHGTRLFTIGIGSVDRNQLEVVADNPDQVFIGSSFDYLEEVLSSIRDAICIEISSVQPGIVCLGQTLDLTLNGSGFTSNLNPSRASCRFQTSSNQQYSTTPTETITATRIVCPLPAFEEIGSVLLQVSLDGQTFIGSRVSLLIDDCKTISMATPTEYCRGRQPTAITLTGSGFSANLDQSRAKCRYRASSQEFITTPSAAITGTTIRCPPPSTDYTGVLSLQVTTTGEFYIDDVITIRVNDCTAFGSLMPEEWCLHEEVEEIQIRGEGFTDNVMLADASCTFRTSDQQEYMTQPRLILSDLFVCPLPRASLPAGNLGLRINNGFASIGGEMQLRINDCTEIDSVQPSKWCVFEEVDVIEVRGQGFTGNLVMENASCTFRISEEEYYVTQPSQEVSSDLFVCPLPDVNLTVGYIHLRIHNGFGFIGDEMRIEIDDCTERDYGFVAGIILGFLALLLILGLCMLWCCLPLISGTIVGGLPPPVKREPTPEAPPTPPPSPPPVPAPPPIRPGRKWEVVDASYYGGRGAGGMKPMKVTWGGRGATELGSKLTKAKDANLIEVVVIAGEEAPGDIATPIPVTPPPSAAVKTAAKEKGPGCWDRIKAKLKRWYAVLSSYRPVFTNHGTLGKHILWFPGPNIQEKLTAQANQDAPNGLVTSVPQSTSPRNGTSPHEGTNGSPPSVNRSVPPPRRAAPTPPRGQHRAPPHPPPATTLSQENLLSEECV